MQNAKPLKYSIMQTIKTKTTGLGKNNWENYLMQQHAKELDKALHKMNLPHDKHKIIMLIHKKKVTKENVQKVYTHPILIFLDHLLDNRLKDLESYTSYQNNEKLKVATMRNNLHEFINFKSKYCNQGSYYQLISDFYLIKQGYKPITITLK